MSNQSANQTEIKAVEAVGAVSAILAKTKRPYNRKPKLVIVEPVVVVPEPESEDDSSSDEDESSDEEEEEPRSIPDLKTPKITMELPEPEDDESSDEEEEEEDESDQAEADEVEALSVMTPQDIQARYNMIHGISPEADSDDDKPLEVLMAVIAKKQRKLVIRQRAKEEVSIIQTLRDERRQVIHQRMVSLRYQLEAFAKEDEEVEAGIQDRILLTIHYDDKPAAKLENTIVKAKGTNSYSRHKELTNKKVVRYTMDEILQEGDEFHRTGKGKHGVFIWKNKALLNSQQNQSYKSFADALKQQQVEEGTDISLNAWKAFLIKRDGKLYKLDDIFIK